MLNLAEGFIRLGRECDLILVNARGEYLNQVGSGLRIVNLAATRALTSLPALVRYLRQERPAALVTALGHINLLALLAVRIARVPVRVLVSEHNSFDGAYATRITGRLFPLLVRRLYPAAHGVIAVSGGVADSFSRVTRFPRERVQVIHNPVITPGLLAKAAAEPAELLPPDGKPFILAVGRLNRLKNFALLIDAFALVREKHDVRLVLLGEGEERARLEQLSAAHGLRLGDDILLPGFTDNPYAFMRLCRVFVLSSDSEGLPTVLIEALACKARVVSTDCPSGPREILRDGRLGSLVPVGDAVALAEAIGSVLESGDAACYGDELESYTQDHAASSYLRALAAA
jgi:glycosyltransferase involved in cell wall biosynthesis